MARLSLHVTNVDEKTLELLEENNVLTVLDFLDEDPDHICNISGLSFKTVTDITRNLISKFAVKPTTGLEIYTNMLSTAAKLSTGIECLDEVLEGGILTGNISELCGLSGEGKTQICFSIAVHFSHILKQTVHFVDTKHDFSALRIQNMLKAQRCNDDEVQSAMEKIQVTSVRDIYQLISFLHELQTLLISNPCRIVIIDSLPVLLTPFITETGYGNGFRLLNHIAQVMKKVSVKFQIVFFVVNLALEPFNTDDVCEEKPQNTEDQSESETVFMDGLKPALGKMWCHTPSYRLLIQKHPILSSTQRRLTLVKSIDIESSRNCVIEINDFGITSVSTPTEFL